MSVLELSHVCVTVENCAVLQDVSLTCDSGQVCLVTGANGSGKTSLVHAIMGHPRYQIAHGTISYTGKEITGYTTIERVRSGIFTIFQHPVELPEISVRVILQELYAAICGRRMTTAEFTTHIHPLLQLLELDTPLLERKLTGFSGGERKKIELLQALCVRPRLLILDEIDSGLDEKTVQVIGTVLAQLRQACPYMGIVCISHYEKLPGLLTVDRQYIMDAGRVKELDGN